MKKSTGRKIQWLPILLIAWNLFDIFVHVRADLAEPLRISGNIVGIVAGLIILFGGGQSGCTPDFGRISRRRVYPQYLSFVSAWLWNTHARLCWCHAVYAVAFGANAVKWN